MNALAMAHAQMLEDGAPPEALRRSAADPYEGQTLAGEPFTPADYAPAAITNSGLARRVEAAKRLRADIALMVSDEDGLLSESDRQYIRDSFEGETTLDVEIAAALRAADDDHVQLLGIEARIKELAERKDRLKRRDEMRLGLIEQAMIALGVDKLETPLGTVSLRRNPPSVVIDDESQIPTQFFVRAEPEVSKASLRKVLIERHRALEAASAVKDGRRRGDELLRIEREFPELPGCHLQTDLVSVQVRRK